MQRRLRQACTAVREHSAANYAKMATASGFFCSVDVIVTRATSPSDVPLHERYVHELLKAFSVSGPACLRRFSLSFTRRLGRTKSWRVALKCLLLLHRLLRSETSPYFRSELLWSKTNGLISLYPCRFRDDSSANSELYTAFVRSYAHFLDEALNCAGLSLDHHKPELEQQEEKVGFSEKMRELGRVVEILPQLQSLIDRAMECRPVGPVARSLVVKSVMKSIVRDSFACYDAFRREIPVVLDDLFKMPHRCCVKAFGVYKKAGEQADELFEFYGWCKEMGFCGCYEYPFVDKIPLLQIQALERFLNGMWQFTESEGSESLSVSQGAGSSAGSESLSDEEEEDRVEYGVKSEGIGEELVGRKKFYCVEEEQPLIQFEDGSDWHESWEALLEASVNMSPIMQHSFNNSNIIDNGSANGNHMNNGSGDQRGGRNMMMMACNSNGVNPFNQPWITQNYNHGYSASNSAYSREGFIMFVPSPK